MDNSITDNSKSIFKLTVVQEFIKQQLDQVPPKLNEFKDEMLEVIQKGDAYNLAPGTRQDLKWLCALDFLETAIKVEQNNGCGSGDSVAHAGFLVRAAKKDYGMK